MADGAPQIWDIPLTPAQRWALVQLPFAKQSAPTIVDAAAGKALRRALRAFGLMEIRDTLRAHNEVSAEYSTDPTVAMHRITAENLECVLGWSNVPRLPAVELDAGEVFDVLEQLKADPAWKYSGPIAPAFVSDAGQWTPPTVDPFSMTCPSCRQQFDLSELGKR